MSISISIMQPYFLPYIGYFQLIEAADQFVIYDNIQYTKKGWINRNRILKNGSDEYITLPLKKDSDYLDVRERTLSDNFEKDGQATLRKIAGFYRKAPYYNEVFPMVERIYQFEDKNLFNFIFHSLKEVCAYLQIDTEFVVSSTIGIDHALKSEDKVLAICKALNADVYINPIGGTELYSKERFQENGIKLQFLKANPIEYPQFKHDFVPWLSILDVMMFNSVEQIKTYLTQEYSLE